MNKAERAPWRSCARVSLPRQANNAGAKTVRHPSPALDSPTCITLRGAQGRLWCRSSRSLRSPSPGCRASRPPSSSRHWPTCPLPCRESWPEGNRRTCMQALRPVRGARRRSQGLWKGRRLTRRQPTYAQQPKTDLHGTPTRRVRSSYLEHASTIAGARQSGLLSSWTVGAR